MNRYRRIEYSKFEGCSHDDEGNLVGGIEIPMVAMYDSEHLTEAQARELLMRDEESQYLMLIRKSHYDNILRPAVNEIITNEEKGKHIET